MPDSPSIPVRVFLDMFNIGIQALVDSPEVLDRIWDTLPSAELAKMKTYYASNPPDVVPGYARKGAVFPMFAIVLSSDRPKQHFIGEGEIATLDDNDQKIGNEYHRWTEGKFTVLVYAAHPDICSAYYRVAKAIVNAGIPYLINRGLDNPTLDGAELAPDPRYTPDNMFVRRLTITVEYDETWTQDALWVALNGEPEPYTTDPDRVGLGIKHEDVGGAIRPRIFASITND